MGATGVEAIKLEDGYVAYAGTTAKEVVTLTPNQASATVVLKLGGKAGGLLATVKDKYTGEAVTSFQVAWLIVDDDEQNGTYSGGERVTQWNKRAIVPPGKWLLVIISAKGYKKWMYHDPSDPSRPAFLRWQPGEEKELRVELEPQAPAAS